VSNLRPVHGSARDVLDALRVWLGAPEEPEPLIVQTSGSTGAPKRVVLSRPAVLASVAATHRALGGPGRWVLALPATYVAGLMVLARSVVADRTPVLLDAYPSLAAANHGWAPGPSRRYISLVPTQLHRMLDSPMEVAALGAMDAILLGGGPIDPELRARAAAARLRVVATYGASETCGGCVYDGVPLDGVDVALGDDGRIRIGGPTLFDGYDDDWALTRETLADGWFQTSDLGRVDEDGRLEVVGRLDDVVVSGGVNVATNAVAGRLREHPAITAAEVLGLPDPEWGQRVVAFVVGTVSLDEARDWAAAGVPRAWAPRQLVVLESLPMLANGKVNRVALRGLA
jgi:o-succinylbenzoate---CoA ligase